MKQKTEFYNTDFLRSEELWLKLTKTLRALPEEDLVPSYQFQICLPDGTAIGTCDLRIGHTRRLYYGGNIGYRIHEPYRGHHYAGKACRLLFTLAKKHGMTYVLITCNPENIASAKTCEYVGGKLLETVDLPPDNDMYRKGERRKRVYRIEL